MMQIKCEMCGSSDLVKENSLYVCKHCGMKYSPEEAKKMMVEIEGAVKIDNTEEIANLYVLAKRAKESENYKEAQNYYSQILLKAPTDWEAAFYSLIFDATNCVIAQIAESCDKITLGIPSVIKLVKNTVTDREELKRICNEMANEVNWAVGLFFETAQKHFDYDWHKKEEAESSAVYAAYEFAYELRMAFPNKEYIDSEILCIKQAMLMQSRMYTCDAKHREIYINNARYLKQYCPSYEVPLIGGVTTQQIESGLSVEEIEAAYIKDCKEIEEQTKAEDEKSKKKFWTIVIVIAVVMYILGRLGIGLLLGF